jgi:hypothetical protein
MRRIIALFATMLLSLSLIAAGAPADRQTSDVYELATGEAVEGAIAHLTRTDTGVGYTLRTSGLEKGHAASIWWVIFNNPEECEHGEGEAACGMGDLFDPAVNIAVMSGGGHVIGNSGRANFAGHLTTGQITNEHPHPAFTDGPGLTEPRGAEIHLVVRSHGPVIPGMNHGMFNSFEVGCTPGTSGGFGDGPNECADLQFAVFK